jgi:hypothetical protein
MKSRNEVVAMVRAKTLRQLHEHSPPRVEMRQQQREKDQD